MDAMSCLGKFEKAAELLLYITFKILTAILVHCQTGIANDVTTGKLSGPELPELTS